MPGKGRSVAALAVAEVLTMGLWFVSAAILPEMVAEGGMGPERAAALSSAVQIGFVVGALALAVHGTADRLDPRHVFAASGLMAAGANAALLTVPLGGAAQILLRGVTGACLAGVYPVGMKIVIGWGTRDRGLLVGLLVGALTVGNALPHLLAFLGGSDWRATVVAASSLAAVGALLVLLATLGPQHARAASFDPGALRLAWTDRPVRLAYAGYLGHMWELFAFWAWIGAALSAAFAERLGAAATDAARLVTFATIAVGGLFCVPAGWLADRIGKARVAQVAMIASGAAGLATAAAFNGPVWLTVALVLVWGVAVIPDSAQFSALVADAAPPDRAGSLMTFQTALGFTLTFFTVQAVPSLAEALGWPATLALMAVGPAFGVEAMRRLIRLTQGRLPDGADRATVARHATESVRGAMQDHAAVQVRVTGRVQGVSYRAWARAEAERLGLSGWVRNEPDGSVSALLAGPAPQVARVIEAMRVGPRGARVTGLDSAPADAPARPGFHIRP